MYVALLCSLITSVKIPDLSAASLEQWWTASVPCPEGMQIQGRARRAVWCDSEVKAHQGRFTLWYPNRIPMLSGAYVHGHIEGMLRRWYPSGALRVVTSYVAGRQEGEAITCFDQIPIRYVDREFDRVTFWFANGEKAYEIKAVDGKEEITWLSCPKSTQVSYMDGKEHGLAIAWHVTGGRSMEGQFFKGTREGDWQFWHPNGARFMEGNLVKGIRHGAWKVWSSDGTLIETQEWKMGEKMSPVENNAKLADLPKFPEWPHRLAPPDDPAGFFSALNSAGR
jgi:antitoxin component YwqK of YwqJK toxin-antitoxin module